MQTVLASLAAVCGGRRVLVVGSSPGVRLPAARPGDVVYAVNGGLGCTQGRAVDLWQVNGRADRASLRIAPTPLRRAWLEHGRDRHLTGLVVFMRDVEGFGTVKELAARGCTWGWSVEVMKKWRVPLMAQIDAPAEIGLRASAGVTGLVLVALAGAATVVACGFSRQTGYAYLPDHALTTSPRVWPHDEADVTVRAALRRRLGDRFQTTAPDLIAEGVQDVPWPSLISSAS